MFISLTLRGCVIECAGIMGFVLIAGLLTIFFEHPELVQYSNAFQDNGFSKRAIPALAMGIYTAAIIKLASHRTGVQINPAATITFYRLGKINLLNATLFVIVQFAGALLGVIILSEVLGVFFSHPTINFGNTQPRAPYSHLIAFFAETIISFLFMFTGLVCATSEHLKKYSPIILGTLISLFVLIETPLSGMSLNPARSFAASFISGKWEYLWIYFVAPNLGMLLAAECFVLYYNSVRRLRKVKLIELPLYPA